MHSPTTTAAESESERPFDLGGALAPRPEPEPELARTHGAYYALRPLLPRAVQLALRRAYAPMQRRAQPDWPMDPAIRRRFDDTLCAEIERRGGDADLLGLWPDRRTFAYVLTHDVEGPTGLAAIEPLLALERRYGVRSTCFLVADDYTIPPGTLDMLRDAGCEVALHGIHHDGEMFRDHAAFRAMLPRVREVMAAWGAVGFRSPATRRNGAWMPELGCLYDTSYPDADPFEPQPGGAGTVMPFFLGELVELPITLPQDHTLMEILRLPAAATWIRKADWVAAMGGLVNVIVHPDYTRTPARLEQYELLLRHLTARPDGWHALAREVAAWWRARARLARGLAPADAAEADWFERAGMSRARRGSNGIVITV